jgi:hypothetical protein
MKRKITLPNILAIAAALLIVGSLIKPWWSLDIEVIGKTYIYPYIIRGPATEVIGYRKTAQMPLLTGALVACVVLALIGSVLKKTAGRIVLLLTGILGSLVVWRFYARAASIASRYNMTVQGHAVARWMAFSPLKVAGKLEPGFYLVIAGAVVCLLAALVHGKFRPDPVKAKDVVANDGQA